MDNIVVLTTAHKNELEFDLTVEGLDDTNATAQFVLKLKEYDVAFTCSRNGSKWEVTIPAMPHLDQKTCPFSIEVVIDGYFFTPLTGQVNIISQATVTATVPKQQSVPSSIIPSVVKPEEEEVKEISKPKRLDFKGKEYDKEQVGVHIEEPKSFDNIIDKIIADKNKSKAQAEEQPAEEKELSAVEILAKEIVNDIKKDEHVSEEDIPEELKIEEPFEEVVVAPISGIDTSIEEIKNVEIEIPKVEIPMENVAAFVTGKKQREASAKVGQIIHDIKNPVKEAVVEDVPVIEEPVLNEKKDAAVEKIVEEIKAKAPVKPKRTAIKKKITEEEIIEDEHQPTHPYEKDLKAKEVLGQLEESKKVTTQKTKKKTAIKKKG